MKVYFQVSQYDIFAILAIPSVYIPVTMCVTECVTYIMYIKCEFLCVCARVCV